MIEVNKAYKVLLTIILVLQFYFFDIIPKINELLINANSEYSKKIQLFLFVVMCLILAFSKKRTMSEKKYFSLPIMFLLISIFLISIASAKIYDQSMLSTISTYYSFYLVIAYFPLSYFISNKENLVWFYGTVVKMSLLYLILQNIQGIIYKITHVVFLFYTPIALQNLSMLQRFTEGTEIITFVAVLISMKPFLLGEKWKMSDYSTLVLVVSFNLFFSQGRMYLMIASITITVSILIQLYTSRHKSLVYILSPIIILGILFLFGKIISILNFTNTTGERAASYIIRTYSYEYFYQHFFYNKWFGIGFADPTQYKWLLKGAVGFDAGGGLMTYQDVGMVGTAGILGISGLIFFAIVVLSLVVFLFRGRNKAITTLILLYIGVSLISLSPLDTGRIFPFVLILAISDYSQSSSEEGNKIVKQI